MRGEHENKDCNQQSPESLFSERHPGTADRGNLLGRAETRQEGSVGVGVVLLLGVLTREK